jgi:hypothetical protein
MSVRGPRTWSTFIFTNSSPAARWWTPPRSRNSRSSGATYRKLITSNCLCHREVGGILRDTLNATFASPFTFLDIACGDASVMKTALRGTKVRYHVLKLLVFLPFRPPCPYLGTSKEAPGVPGLRVS